MFRDKSIEGKALARNGDRWLHHGQVSRCQTHSGFSICKPPCFVIYARISNLKIHTLAILQTSQAQMGHSGVNA
jgi:hypothetical protein